MFLSNSIDMMKNLPECVSWEKLWLDNFDSRLTDLYENSNLIIIQSVITSLNENNQLQGYENLNT